MPYTLKNAPAAVKALPKGAQEIWVAAFNAAHAEYKNEPRAHATAWSAVKAKYKKGQDGQWHKKRDSSTGTFVALVPPSGIAEQMAMGGSESPEDLHLTLAYVTAEADAATLSASLNRFAAQYAPVSGTINGVTVFENGDSRALVALFDSPQLPHWRQKLIDATGLDLFVDQQHGWLPHITLAYLEPGEERDASAVIGMSFTFDRLRLVFNADGQMQDFQLRGTQYRSRKEDSMDLKALFESIKQLFDPLLVERAVKDVSNWDGAASNYDSTEAYCKACLINVNEGDPSGWTQDKCKLPVRGPGDSMGMFVRQACHAAAVALGGGRGGVKKPDGVAQDKWDSAVKHAANELLGAYGMMEETPPDSLYTAAGKTAPKRMARAISSNRLFGQIMEAVSSYNDQQMQQGMMDMSGDCHDLLLVRDLYYDAGNLFLVADQGGTLYTIPVEVDANDVVTLGTMTNATEAFPATQQRSLKLVRQTNGKVRYLAVSASSVLNRDGEIDSTQLFDSFVAYAHATGEYPVLSFFHEDEVIRFGQADFLARDGDLYLESGELDDTPLAQAAAAKLEAEPEQWGLSIGYLPTVDPQLMVVRGLRVPVYTRGIHRETSILPKQRACALFTQIGVAQEVKRMNQAVYQALVQLVGEEQAKPFAQYVDETQRQIQEQDRIRRQTTAPASAAPAATAPATEPATPPAPVQREVTLDEAAVTAIVAQLLQAPALQTLVAEVGTLKSGLAALAALPQELSTTRSALELRLKAVERSEEEKRREWTEDLPAAPATLVTYRPRAAHQEPATEQPLSAIAEQTTAKMNTRNRAPAH